MIKTLSPYYVTTPWVSTATGLTSTFYTLYIYIWSGAKASVPSVTEYTIKKENVESSTGSDKINISRLVNDFITFTAQTATTTGDIDGINQMWVKTDVTYTTTNPTDGTTHQEASTVLASRGYTYGNEGENVTVTSGQVLMQGDNYKIDRTGYFVVPIHIDESVGKSVTVISYPSNEISSTINMVATTDSEELIQYIWIDASKTTADTSIEMVYGVTRKTVLVKDELKYTPVQLLFQNKDGAEQIITMFKERRESLSVTDTTYESDRGQPLTGMHQFVRGNVQGRTKLKLNSGFVLEENKEGFRQLYLSERIWILEGTTVTPVNISSKSIDYKTRENEKLINYEIEVEYSYNEINNI
tara:strand:+ start:4879 stop:5949 length:1071 start_codon:yes stop_codon:yes gene_type:complete